MSTLFQDLRYAVRMLAKSPSFTAAAVLVLASSIGVNSTLFSFIDRVHLRPVIKERPDEVVSVFTASKGPDRGFRSFTYAEFQALRQEKEVFADVAAFRSQMRTIGRDDSLRRAFVFYTTDNYFSLHGAKPFRGRFFSEEETRPGAAVPVVVASYGLWQRLGKAQDLVGSTIRVDSVSYTVIGVAPSGFSGTTAVLGPEAWLPMGMTGSVVTTSQGAAAGVEWFDERQPNLMLVARRRAGLSLVAAQARLSVVDRHLNALSAEPARELVLTPPSRVGISNGPMTQSNDAVIGPAALGMAGCVLLVAGLNLANLLLARGVARRRETAVRAALGASRRRLIRQLLIEGLLLAAVGGALGLLLSYWCSALLLRALVAQLNTTQFTVALDLSPDARVLAATFAYSIAAVLVFSLVPAWRATRVDLARDLAHRHQTVAGRGAHERAFSLRHCLVIGQVALCLMLLSCAGLLLRSGLRAGGLALGFEPERQAITEVDYSISHVSPEQGLVRQRDLAARAQALPGVDVAALASQAPYSMFWFSRGVRALGRDETRALPAIDTAVSTGYFAALGARLLRGRDFTDAESFQAGARRVAVIDQTLARSLFADQEPLGQRIALDGETGGDGGMDIVGIVRSPRHHPMDDAEPRRLYRPLAQAVSSHVYLHLRTRDAAMLPGAIAALRQGQRAIDPDNPFLLALPLTSFMHRNMMLWSLRLATVILGVLAALALTLSLVGVYAVKAYLVGQRTHEIGVRVALGASPAHIVSLMLRQAALQTSVALLLGLGLAIGAGHLVRALLLGTNPNDPLVLVTATASLAAAVLLACYLPARRATKVDPMVALRCE